MMIDVAAAVGGIDQLHLEAVLLPVLGDRARRQIRASSGESRVS